MDQRSKTGLRALAASLMGASALASAHGALAQAAQAAQVPPANGTALQEVVVTAQKREENLQKVPISIVALGAQKLQQLNVKEFGDYVKLLPSVSYQTIAPSVTNVYMRGIASGGDGNHSGPQPSVGVYLDEQPITTIQGVLDVHVYDIARVEQLAGPQGTLYGANSESGTLRIITNKPDTHKFEAGYDIQGNHVDHGDFGGVAEGFVNIPITDKIAVRLVAFDQHDAGYIDNVPGTRTYPVSGVTVDNTKPPYNRAENNYNDVDTYGGRIAVKVDLNENWTISPTFMAQDQRANGIFGYDSTKGDLKVSHIFPEAAHDRWAQAALTIQGKVRDFDIVYSGGYFSRTVDAQSDYSDYSFFYDTMFGSGAYITDSAGNVIDPSQKTIGHDTFTKQNHELRISSPQQYRLRVVGGLFFERQVHDIVQDYEIANFDPALSVSNHPGTIWLTDQVRIDRDVAAFGQATYDITDKLQVTGGVRVFEYRNTLRGFFGYGSGFSSKTGEAACFDPRPFRSAPCLNLDKTVDESGETYKGTLTYKFDPTKLVYFTASSGFRPGGINRRGTLPPYVSDFLYNYEVGWKTSWFDNRFRWNGAFFYEQWDDFQFSFLAANGLTQIANAGAAEVKGLESDIAWQVTPQLNVTASGAYVDAELTQPYCGDLLPNGQPDVSCSDSAALAPRGQELPVTPKFKGNVTARYTFPFMGWNAHLQGTLVYQGASWADLRTLERGILGRQRAYASVDLAAGLEKDRLTMEVFMKNAFDERGDVYRYAECQASVCGAETYIVPIQPMTIGIRFGQRF